MDARIRCGRELGEGGGVLPGGRMAVRRYAHPVVRRVTTPRPPTNPPTHSCTAPARLPTSAAPCRASRCCWYWLRAPSRHLAPSPLPPPLTHPPTHPPNPLSPAFPRSHFVPTPSAAQIQSELSRTRSKAVIVQARSRASGSSLTQGQTASTRARTRTHARTHTTRSRAVIVQARPRRWPLGVRVRRAASRFRGLAHAPASARTRTTHLLGRLRALA